MKLFFGPELLITPKMTALTAAVIFAVPLMLWYQSSRYETGTETGISRFSADLKNDDLERAALNPMNPDCNQSLLLYVSNLKKNGYRTAALTWLKFGAEHRSSARIMLEYAAALEQSNPAMSAEWRKRAAALNLHRKVK